MKRHPEDRQQQGEDLPVLQVSQEEFSKQWFKHLLTAPQVDMESWIRSSRDTAIINMGAGPCLIIYFDFPEVNQIISGHYPSTLTKDNREGFSELLKMMGENVKTMIPEVEKLESLEQLKEPRFGLGLAGIVSYIEMLSEVKILMSAGWRPKAYLFGMNTTQSFGALIKSQTTDRVRLLVRQYERRMSPVSDLLQMGFQLSDIKDHRFPLSTRDEADSTIYIPDTGILHKHESF